MTEQPAERATAQHHAAKPAQAGGWGALRRLFAPRLNRSQLMIGALCAVLGFAVVVQVHQTSEANLSGLSQDELVRVLDEASDRADSLDREASALERERAALESGSDTRAAALAAAERNAQVQGILTGRLPAQGPGVRVVVTDGSGTVRPATMLNLLEELRNAGAEAISLDGTRVVASSAFTGSAGRVALGDAVLRPPYTWYAIGDPATIATALEIPGGADAAIRRDGGQVKITRLDQVTISATVDLRQPRYATPVPASTG